VERNFDLRGHSAKTSNQKKTPPLLPPFVLGRPECIVRKRLKRTKLVAFRPFMRSTIRLSVDGGGVYKTQNIFAFQF